MHIDCIKIDIIIIIVYTSPLFETLCSLYEVSVQSEKNKEKEMYVFKCANKLRREYNKIVVQGYFIEFANVYII